MTIYYAPLLPVLDRYVAFTVPDLILPYKLFLSGYFQILVCLSCGEKRKHERQLADVMISQVSPEYHKFITENNLLNCSPVIVSTDLLSAFDLGFMLLKLAFFFSETLNF